MKTARTVLVVLMFLAICLSVGPATAQFKEPLLTPGSLKIGYKGVPTFLDGKVFQVLDDKSAIIGIEDGRYGKGKYQVKIILDCDTTGMVDDMFWRGGGWSKWTGKKYLKVTETRMLPTVSGGTKTMFVLKGAD